MSRLHLKAASDAGKTEITARGHQRIEATIYYGSASVSRKAASLLVSWPKGATKPIITISLMEDCEEFSSRVWKGEKKLFPI